MFAVYLRIVVGFLVVLPERGVFCPEFRPSARLSYRFVESVRYRFRLYVFDCVPPSWFPPDCWEVVPLVLFSDGPCFKLPVVA